MVDQTTPEKLLDCAEAAETLGYTPRHLRLLATAGTVPYIMLPGSREYRFRPSTLQQLIEENEQRKTDSRSSTRARGKGKP
jgi:excisionase family DNA binding protein